MHRRIIAGSPETTYLDIIAPTNVYLSPSCLGFVKVESISGRRIQLNPEYTLVDIVKRGDDHYLVISGGPQTHYIKAGQIIGHRVFFYK
nr:hypothetical protein K-LCC10_0384 [Kaumoebavirus]